MQAPLHAHSRGMAMKGTHSAACHSFRFPSQFFCHRRLPQLTAHSHAYPHNVAKRVRTAKIFGILPA